MTWSLNIYGHGKPADEVKEAARAAYAELVELAGAKGGSLSGTDVADAFSISFPEPTPESESKS